MSSSDSRWRTFAQNGESRYSAGWAVEVAKTVSSRLACWIGNLTISAIFRHGQSATATFRKGRLTIFTGLALAVIVAPMALTKNLVLIGALIAASIVLLPANNAGISACIASVTPAHLQARVNAAGGVLSLGLAPLAPPAAGLSIPAAGGQASMFIGSALLIASLAPLAASRDVRELSKPAHWPTTAHSS